MSVETDLALAGQRLQQGQYKPAYKAAKSALRKAPKSPAALNLAGIALSGMGQRREAVELFRKALKLAPEFHDARKNLGQTLVLLGQPEPAAALLEKLVTQTPKDAGAWYLLAQARANAGRLEAAEAAASTSIGLAPTQARALNLRALLRDRQGLIAEALEDYRAALRINPDDVETLINISLPLARQLRSDEALEAVRRAVRLAPGHLGARLRLAMQLVEMGQSEAAIEEYRQVLARDPAQPEAIERLAELQGPAENTSLAPRLRAALQAAPRRSEARAALLFAQARIADQAGERAQAEKALAEANREMAAILPYDAAGDRALTNRLLARFAGPLPDRAPDPARPRPVYVVGLPRSGTTLTEAILGAHPEVVPLGERAAAGILLKPVIDGDLPFDAAAVARFVEGDRRLLPELPDGTRAYVDKMPENHRLVGFLKTAYPEARIVNLRRDPRDVALSMWRGHFAGTALAYTYDLAGMAQRFNLYAETMAHWHRVCPGAILDLRYEEMAADVEWASRSLASFCGLDWTPEMARPDQAAGPVLTLSAAQLRQPVHTRSVGRWREHVAALAPFIAGLDLALWPEIAG